MKKSLLLFVSATLLSVASFAMPAPQSDIVDTAVAAGQFKTLVTAVQAAGLVETLKGPGPLTVFAPTDAAFAKLPAGTVQALLGDKAMLTKILTYHVVSGALSAQKLACLGTVKTVEGGNVVVRYNGKDLFLNGSKVVMFNIAAKNGIIQVIDTVLIPQ